MPILTIYGMPEVKEASIEKLIEKLVAAASKTLKIPSSQISVFFPVDRVKKGLGEELVCFVNGLFESAERTTQIRQELADTIALEIKGYAQLSVPQCKLVEVFINRFNQASDGFASHTLTQK